MMITRIEAGDECYYEPVAPGAAIRELRAKGWRVVTRRVDARAEASRLERQARRVLDADPTPLSNGPQARMMAALLRALAADALAAADGRGSLVG